MTRVNGHWRQVSISAARNAANRLSNADFGANFLLASTGIYKDNLVFDVTTPFSDGTDGGGNVSVP